MHPYCIGPPRSGPLYVGTADYRVLVHTSVFTDKTLLIKTVLESEEKVLITAPKGFGKTCNLDMLKRFLQIQVNEKGEPIDKVTSPNYKLFAEKKLKIFQEREFFDEHFGNYPVIHVNLQCISNDFKSTLNSIRKALSGAFAEHSYLVQHLCSYDELANFDHYWRCTETKIYKLKTGLQFLSRLLHKYFNKKVFVLIDDYDGPIHAAMCEMFNTEEVNGLLSSILSNTLQENECVGRAFLTGTCYFRSVGLFGSNDVAKYMFLTDSKFAKFYGLTEDEIDNLLSKLNRIEHKKELKLQYGGYMTTDNTEVYSTTSIICYLAHHSSYNPFNCCRIFECVKQSFHKPIVKHLMSNLLERRTLIISLFKNVRIDDVLLLLQINRCNELEWFQFKKQDFFLSLLLQLGFLTYVRVVDEDFDLYEIKIANEQARCELSKINPFAVKHKVLW